ncbi:probable poly(beta-D-mannuronate) O-acetylase [Hydrogenimonas sp.]|nr:probable poly(beta-D-mannuronate) O-acetylase [Hydrogenimonas sp.]
MLFNSFEYIFLFLPVVFFLYFLINRLRYATVAKLFLIGASLFFYSWWNPVYLPIILLSVFFNFAVGSLISRKSTVSQRVKKALLLIGVTANLAMLGYFKYSDFFLENINIALDTSYPLLHLALPLGISFFTFQQITYLVDSYKGKTEEYSFLNYTLFVTFFPQLIAGPIVHHKEMLPQFALKSNLIVNHKNIAMGLFIFSIGLFKKVMIADRFAVWATRGFDVAENLNMLEAWVTSLSYTFQLYFDFSGYTDMAIGAALLFNIRLPINFDSPYKARNIRDFWRRWHMTLTRFLKDYLYIPLGGNRHGRYRTYLNIFIVFFLAGIWHGAGWTFIFWGTLHGLALIIHRIWSAFAIRMPTVLAWFLTFNFVNIAWIFFRAKDFDDALKVLNGMFFGKIVLPAALSQKLGFLKESGVEFGSYLGALGTGASTVAYLLAALGAVLLTKNSTQLMNSGIGYVKMTYASLLFLAAALSLNRISEFIYFNF